jgi:hypothetical protein
MVAAYRLIKYAGHAAHFNNIGVVFLQLSRMRFRFLDIGVQG